MKWARISIAAVFVGTVLGLCLTDAQPKKYPRGRKSPTADTILRRQRLSAARYSLLLQSLPVITAKTWDCRALGQCGAVHDQGQCGDCYIFSATEVCEDAQYVSKIVKPGSGFGLSQQYFLDCQASLGGCNGGDEWEVCQKILSGGCPSTKDYAGSGQSPGRCASTAGMTLYSIFKMGYCDESAGANQVASTQAVKNAMGTYGPISVAVAADADWDNYQAGQVISGNDTDVNHAVLLIGWDDAKGAWLVQNSWSTSWGDQGYAWVTYGAYSIATEAFFVQAQPPVPPGPVPPTPPSPIGGHVASPLNTLYWAEDNAHKYLYRINMTGRAPDHLSIPGWTCTKNK